jgi:hypothetical protein
VSGVAGGWLGDKGVMGVLLELDERPGVDILNGVIML